MEKAQREQLEKLDKFNEQVNSDLQQMSFPSPAVTQNIPHSPEASESEILTTV